MGRPLFDLRNVGRTRLLTSLALAESRRKELNDIIGAVASDEDSTSATVSAIANASPVYTPTNVSTDRAFDANAAAGAISDPPTQAEVENLRDAVLELADVLATLIADLQDKNVLG